MKVGGTVMRVGNDFADITIGDISIITEVYNHHIQLEGRIYKYSKKGFKVIKEAGYEDENSTVEVYDS